jgi:hypothetical protein
MKMTGHFDTASQRDMVYIMFGRGETMTDR